LYGSISLKGGEPLPGTVGQPEVLLKLMRLKVWVQSGGVDGGVLNPPLFDPFE
jgi:hypothetical protein